MKILEGMLAFTLVALPALAAGQGGGGGAGGDLRVTGKFMSDEPTGEPPLEVVSTTNVSNLNADRLDGFDVGDFAVEGSGVGVHYKNLVGIPGGDIDQDCAVNTGCFDGTDSAGFPVTIDQPGSYRLISNLETTDENQTIIDIQTSHVTLDLNGFTIIGPTSCSGTPTSCTPTGTGRGVDSSLSDVTVRGGQVTGMGSNGIDLRHGAAVEKVRAVGNGADGIDVSDDSRVADNVVRINGQNGIDAANGSIVKGNVTVQNGADGMTLPDSRVIGNTASRNAQEGINCGGDCVVRDNRALGNGNIGIRAVGGSVIIGNVVADNTGDGIVNTLAPGTIQDNNVSGNDTGLNIRANSGYGGNVITDNTTNVSGGTEIGTNVCGTDTTCP